MVRRPGLMLTLLLCVLFSVCAVAGAAPAADSVILLIGDGMGPNQIELTRLALGGDPLVMQRLPYSGTVTTYSADSKVTDSAASATAIATGAKTNNGMLGVTPGGQRLGTILERCRERGKATGLVTTDALWGATPAGFAVHVGSRGEYAEIARQLVEAKLQVMMGFGSGYMKPAAAGGARKDDLNLLETLQKRGFDIVTTGEELAKSRRPQLVGLFGKGAPSLAEMTEAALTRLGASKKGFFLMVEESAIDGAGHQSDPAQVVRKVQTLDAAVKAALEFARKRGRTLVLVTADHETGGLRIDAPAKTTMLAKAKGSMWDMAGALNADHSNVAAMMKEWAGVEDLTPAEVERIGKAEQPSQAIAAVLSAYSGVRWTGNGGHTSTPVRVFAFGPGAERFTGELDNTQLPGLIAEVLGVGPFPKR